ncbi:hypothetical protein [Bacillus sp. H2FL2]|uniref:hypothetical protein n=1 Tax=Bacillus sp. H2FL2 TaxID=2994531 RepID=UPI003A52254D
MAETKKYVRILKAPCRSIWYADKIGSIFPSLGTWENAYKVDSPDRALYIRKEDAQLIVTEKRPAKVGERVLLTAPTNTKGKHRVGDVFTVREFGETGVHVTEDEFMTLWHKEYEVIVNNEVENEEADEMEIDLNAMGYDELMAHGDAVMEAIKKRMFQEGFRSAKQAQRKLAKMNTEKSAQARRDEIVEQAKADVEDLFKRDIGYRHDFIVNSEKRTVVALRKSFGEGYVRDRGIAKAAPDDCFNVHIGKAIALRRALGLKVPDEYLNAPQPTEVRVGDIVCGNRGDEHYYSKRKTFTITSDSVDGIDDGFLYKENTRDWIERDQIGRIIDDSREEVGE